MQTKIFFQRKLVALSIGLAAFVISANGETAQELRKYYAMRDAAVDRLVAEKFDSAAIFYRQAFGHKEHPFGQDVQNALFCELKSGAPDTATCRHYFALLGGSWLKYYYKEYARTGIDTLLMAQIGSAVPEIFRAYDTEASSKIHMMNKRDQEPRKAFYAISKGDSIKRMEMRKLIARNDSINILELKELMKTVDVFNERVVYPSSLSIFFTHLFDYDGVRDFFEPHLRQAVLDGRMSARDYASYMDQPRHNKPSYDTSFGAWLYGHGSVLLNICSTNPPERHENKFVAYFNFDGNNGEHANLLREIDRRREAIYLAPIVESSIREFKLWLYVQRHDYWQVLRAEPISIICSEDEGRKAIQKMLDEGIPVIYYIEGEHDFNVK
jgi:hypothetical protein